jgi:hypothetical protein
MARRCIAWFACALTSKLSSKNCLNISKISNYCFTHLPTCDIKFKSFTFILDLYQSWMPPDKPNHFNKINFAKNGLRFTIQVMIYLISYMQ